MTTISTARLRLRDIHLTDWPALHQILSHDDVVRFIEYGPFDELQTREWLSHVIVTKYESPRLIHHLAIELSTCPRSPQISCVIGWIAVTTLAPSSREWALSFALDKDHWGQGYMTEAVAALAEHAFDDLNAHRIIVEVDPDNLASTRVVEKCGFQFEGRLNQKQYIRGEWRDVVLYSILEH